MAWRRPGDKPLSEPMMVSLLTHICVTRPQWVNINTIFLGMSISIKKIRQSGEILFFIMGIPILVRQCLYIESASKFPFLSFVQTFILQHYMTFNNTCLCDNPLQQTFITLRHKQNHPHLTSNIFPFIFSQYFFFFFVLWFTFLCNKVPRCLIDNNTALLHILAWYWTAIIWTYADFVEGQVWVDHYQCSFQAKPATCACATGWWKVLLSNL